MQESLSCRRFVLKRVTDGLTTGLRASIVLAGAVMVLAVTLQVVMRYVFMRPPAWSEELAVLMFSWLTMGGLALGVREGFHVSLNFAVEMLPTATQRAWNRVINASVALLGAYLVFSGVRFLDATTGSVSAAIEYPTEFLTALAPISGVLVCIFALEQSIISQHPVCD